MASRRRLERLKWCLTYGASFTAGMLATTLWRLPSWLAREVVSATELARDNADEFFPDGTP